MILQPVLLAIPDGDKLPRDQRRAVQREHSRRALRQCAELCGAPLDGWQQDGSGVPIPNAGFHWSVSHKPMLAAAVISDRPVGIDVEFVTPRREGLFDLVGSAEEWALLGNRTWNNFYRLFTAKEATLKANGRGVGYLLHTRVCTAGRDVRFQLEFSGQRFIVEHFSRDGHLTAVSSLSGGAVWVVVE